MSCKIGDLSSPKNISANLLFMVGIHSQWQIWAVMTGGGGALGFRWTSQASSQHPPDMPTVVTWSSCYWSPNHFLMLVGMLDGYFWCLPPQISCKSCHWIKHPPLHESARLSTATRKTQVCQGTALAVWLLTRIVNRALTARILGARLIADLQ